MFAKIRLFVCAAVAMAASTGYGQTTDDQTKCAVVTQIMDVPQPDMHRVAELKAYILHVMSVADRNYGTRGKAQILPRMSLDGLHGVIASASVRCRDHPNTTIKDMAIGSYEGIRAIGNELGVNN